MMAIVRENSKARELKNPSLAKSKQDPGSSLHVTHILSEVYFFVLISKKA